MGKQGHRTDISADSSVCCHPHLSPWTWPRPARNPMISCTHFLKVYVLFVCQIHFSLVQIWSKFTWFFIFCFRCYDSVPIVIEWIVILGWTVDLSTWRSWENFEKWLKRNVLFVPLDSSPTYFWKSPSLFNDGFVSATNRIVHLPPPFLLEGQILLLGEMYKLCMWPCHIFKRIFWVQCKFSCIDSTYCMSPKVSLAYTSVWGCVFQ